MAVHLTPVWIWIGGIVRAVKQRKKLHYAVTDTRVMRVNTKTNKTESMYYYEMPGMPAIRQGVADRKCKIGDIIFISSHGMRLIMDNVFEYAEIDKTVRDYLLQQTAEAKNGEQTEVDRLRREIAEIRGKRMYAEHIRNGGSAEEIAEMMRNNRAEREE